MFCCLVSKSRISSLRQCLGDQITIARVKYIDFTKDLIPELNDENQSLFLLHTFKRSSFAHEREVRAMFVSMKHLAKTETIEYGMRLKKLGELKPIDLNQLIDTVYVVPDSPSWYLDLLQKIARRYGLTKEVRRSSLLEDPVY